jgi:hypothetical protein
MKTKKESKFALEKFEVAKLKKSSMNKIIGGVKDDPITGSGTGGRDTKHLLATF